MNSSTTTNLLKLSVLSAGIMLAASQHAGAACSYTVTNNWGNGFTGEIKVTNNTGQTVNNWSVSWREPGASVTNAWNATLSGANPYTASALGWNATLAPGASASFGFQANGTASTPTVNGSLCGVATSSTATTSSTQSSTPAVSSSSSIKSSVAVSSSKSSSSAASSIPAESSWIFEESAVGFCSNSGVIDTKHSGYTGTGFIDTENVIGASILWSINAANNASYNMQIRFGNGGSAARRASLEVNDISIKTLDFPTNSNWTQWQTVNVSVPFKAGVNSVKLVAETADGLANIDSISVTGNGVTPAACPTAPTTPAAQDCNSVTSQPILQVAADGSATYKTIAAALNTISSSNTTPTQIRIKPGTYREKLLITKPLVTFCGQTGKEASTILTYNDGASTLKADGTAIGTSGSASVTIKTNDISMENITIENSFGIGSQAVALLAQGQRLQFRNCRLLGNQDTLYTHSGTQYYRNCHIQGTVDFIFGAATAVFENNTIHSVGGGSALTAPSTEQTVPYGLVFLGGKVTATPNVAKGSVALGRNWRPYGAAAYIRTELGQHISAVGWVKMSENTLDTARFSEYLTTGAGANTSARAPQSKQLTATQAATYTIGNIFGSWQPSYSK
ncbi:pectinesterase family protein [Cellvibrio sp. OA-2007]|uniref:pectinesterase family protein n=1 Tax=Cellvibrio sp. OA-2007 TaxID=529823 RepID=UPI00078380C8|nr:pectinesterase family protein [Cellvibrio sp. OA-2007]